MAADAAMGLKNFSSDLGLDLPCGNKTKVELIIMKSVVVAKSRRDEALNLIMLADYNDIDRRILI